MVLRTPVEAMDDTLQDLIERLGSVPLNRIAARPAPGTAVERHLLRPSNGQKHLYELVEGTLVEKAMGFYESRLAAVLIGILEMFLMQHDLGIIVGESAMLRLGSGLVRMPDVSFISWDRLAHHEVPTEPIPTLAPDLAVEILSKGNTVKEMERKLQDYFNAGVRLVWYIDPRRRVATVYTSPIDCITLTEEDYLDGGDVLPGFTLSLKAWFVRSTSPHQHNR